MCLAALACGLHPRFPFVLLANRDERFDRAAAPMAWWPGGPGQPRLLAGRDLAAGGTWLGITDHGRMALVTNVREPDQVLPAAPSRGSLVPQWLLGGHAPLDPAALQALAETPRNGFNLLVADLAARDATGGVVARWLSNRPQAQQRALAAGVHAVSNAALDTPWPKLVHLKQRLQVLLAVAPAGGDGDAPLAAIETAGLAALADPQMADDARLPSTGLPLLRERQLSAAFIRVVADGAEAPAVYGTRCSTVLVVQRPRDGSAAPCSVHVLERSFAADGSVAGDVRHAWTLGA